MDKYDRALLAALIDNGRLTFAELARRINLSPPAVADRVAKLGLPIECVIELRITEKDCQSVLDELARIPQLTLCHRITGDACVLMKAAVASMPELQDLIDRLMKFGISKTSMILSTPFADRQPASLRGQDGNGGCAA
ncbi:Lrp/AsnC family transcriptional regulator [Pseudomonas aeruginosa]|uniref:Lrp/AsnC family transcriptional regulator n=1 Tax=Pseudomonas aeruginosa TaxID=287 RepID=UPI00104ACC3A|nr:Lrp/AsnC family transcriptional regulator [Pseudomonas aeruginosa]